VYVIHGVNVTVQDLHLANASAGVRFYNTSFSRIENVTIASSEYGLYLYLSSNNTLQHINASHGEYGLYLYLSSNNTLQHINASLNDVGLDIYRSDDNTLVNVTANANREDGIELDGAYNRITSCVANGNQDQGLDISGAYNVITENTANDNLIGISFYYVENELSRNVFCNNTLYDIDYDDDESNGDNNTCTTVYQGYGDGWKDEGLTTFGCTYSCTGPPAPAPPQSAALAPPPQLAPTGIPHGPAGAPDLASVAPDPAELLVPTPQVAPAPSAPTNGASDVIWEETVILDVTDAARVTSAIDALSLTGKFYLYATLASSTGQLLAFAIAPFYVTDQDYALSLTTDRPIYKPGETVTITGTLENMGAARDFAITVTADGVPIYTDTASVVADSSYPFTASTTAVASFTLTGLVDGLNVTDRVRVEAPAVNASLEAPTLVGRDPFDVTIALVNTGNVSADLTVTLGAEAWTVTVPGGEAQYLQTQQSLTGNATLTATVTGDVTRTLQQDVVYGEAATITVAPDDVYVEGPVAIPYTIRNTGRLAMTFTATFTLDGQIVTRDVYLPVGENVSDTFTITLTRGRYTMAYASPFWGGQVPVDVESEPDLVLTSFPENVTLTLDERANLTVTIANRGSREGEAQLALESPGLFDAATRTWVAGDASADVTVTVQAPDDVEEGTYALVYTLNGQRYATTCTILGAKIAVSAALDRALYAAGANATLTLTVTNLRAMNLSLYARVNLNATDHLRPFNLTEYASTTLSVTLPVAFGSKLLYTVYHSTGRALYINALYLYEQPPDVAGITLTTDRQVYAMGDTVTLRVNVTRADTLTLTTFDLAVTENLTVGDHVYTVDVPLLRSGTYPITYAYGNHTATHPIDVVGYAGRVTESSIDQPAYTAGDTVNLTLVVDVTRAFDGVVVLTLHDPLGAVAGTTSVNHTFTVGANALHVAVPVDTTATGLHTATYKVYAYGSLIFVTSGARYFDAAYVDATPPSITHTPITSGEPDTAIPVYALVTDDVAVEAVALYYRQVGATSYARLPMPKCGVCIDTYNATIPATSVTGDLEYYLNATDGVHVALDGTPATPHRVTVDRAPAAVTLSPPTGVTHEALTLTWTVSDDADFANYTLFQSTTQGTLGTRITTITIASTASYTVTGLAPTTTYHFTVRVTDTGGRFADSNAVSATTTVAPPPAEIPWLYVGLALAAVAIVAILVVSRRGGL
jgi:parallel beta-helix repeat protein